MVINCGSSRFPRLHETTINGHVAAVQRRHLAPHRNRVRIGAGAARLALQPGRASQRRRARRNLGGRPASPAIRSGERAAGLCPCSILSGQRFSLLCLTGYPAPLLVQVRQSDQFEKRGLPTIEQVGLRLLRFQSVRHSEFAGVSFLASLGGSEAFVAFDNKISTGGSLPTPPGAGHPDDGALAVETHARSM